MSTTDERLERRQRSLAEEPGLAQAALEIHAHLELESMLAALLDRLAPGLGADCAFALAPGEERSTWTPIAATVPKADRRRAWLGSVDPERVRASLAKAGAVVDGPGPFTGGDEGGNGGDPAVSIALPVTDTDDRWGALLAFFPDRRPSAEALERARTLLDAVRPAVTNARRLQGLRELVIRDDTAHCFNRRYFESSLPEELARAERFHAALSLIFLDMDNLKEVNQRHGHSRGSQTLREVSRRIRLQIRRFDKLFRFGGDEFCIVLPETEWHGALEVAERVRESIAAKPFLLGEVEDEGGVQMTASLGIAAFPLHARTQADLIEHADRAMQRIKRGTKNSIGIAEIIGGTHGS